MKTKKTKEAPEAEEPKETKKQRGPFTQRFRDGARLLNFNKRIFWWFEILYKLLGITVFVPLISNAFNLTMSIAGFRYLTFENLKQFFRHPLIYLILLVILALAGVYTLVDMGAVVYIIHCARCSQHVGIADVIRFAWGNFRGMLKKGRRRLLILPYLMLPFFSIGQIPELLSAYSAPNNMLMMTRNRSIYMTAAALLLVLVFPFCRFLYAFWYYTLEHIDGREAMQKSAELGKGHHLFDLLHVAIAQAFLFVLYLVLLFLGIVAAVVVGKLFSPTGFLSQVLFSIIKILIVILLVVFTVLGTPVTSSMISLLYYMHKSEKKEPEIEIMDVYAIKGFRHSKRERAFRDKYQFWFGVIESVILLLAVIACTFYAYRAHKGEMNLDIEYLKTMEVTAHRGASKQFPENTMAAFQGAIDEGADWIELDVHLSKDGQIFCMHDDSFSRTAGVKAKAWELTYDEISQLDAGSFKGEEFAGERIPLLSEAIDLAIETGIRLNIEIKPSIQEEGLEEKLVDLIHEKNFTDRCVITSQKYNSITKVKQMDENIVTVYVTSFAYGSVYRLNYADHFSVKQSSVTPSLVRKLHNSGHQIYAWTVNSRDSIHLMIEREVDNIITDNVSLAKRYIDREMTSDTVNRLVTYLIRKIRLGSFRFSG